MSENTREQDIALIAALIKDIKFAMITVQTPEGHLKAHPMTTQQTEFDGDLWFIGSKETEQVRCMDQNPMVNVSYSDPSKSNYVSIGGKAELVEDRAKLEELWSDMFKMYFPEGIDDPKIQLIKIDVYGAEYWESDGKLKAALKMARAAVTGKMPEDLGKNDTVKL